LPSTGLHNGTSPEPSKPASAAIGSSAVFIQRSLSEFRDETHAGDR
jgi:hypothetical protein